MHAGEARDRHAEVLNPITPHPTHPTHPMNPILELLITSTILGIILGVPVGWIVRSLFVARQLERVTREAWKLARTMHRYDGEVRL